MKDNTVKFIDWKCPAIEDGKLTKYNWMVQNLEGLDLGFETDVDAFSYINAQYGVPIKVVRSLNNE